MEKGKFIETDANQYLDDTPLIGMRSAANHSNKFADRFEKYFIKKNNHYYIVENPTKAQKLWADFKHNFYSSERKKYYITSLDSSSCHIVKDTKEMRKIHIEQLKKQRESLKAREQENKIR